jgi:(heptosyl)LPS beta-1,4-glucosyltransferase
MYRIAPPKIAEPLPVSGVVIAFNEADRIERCVASLASVCREVVVVDSGSRDATVEIASRAGARVVHQAWLGFAAQKNVAIAQATQPWVLLLDADEWLREGAAEALRDIFETTAGASQVEQADVWRLLRRTHFLGSPLRFGGWGSERVERLFRPGLRYLPAEVHEKLDLSGQRVRPARVWIEHDTARSHDEYATKLLRYAALWADQRRRAGRRAGPADALLHASAYWLKNYVLRGGFLDGAAGYRYHVCHARYVYRKYALLRAGAQA